MKLDESRSSVNCWHIASILEYLINRLLEMNLYTYYISLIDNIIEILS